MKNIGKPCAGEPHARFDEGGQAKACSLLYPFPIALRLAADARNVFLESIEDTPFVNHPLAKEFCARQAAMEVEVPTTRKRRKAQGKAS